MKRIFGRQACAYPTGLSIAICLYSQINPSHLLHSCLVLLPLSASNFLFLLHVIPDRTKATASAIPLYSQSGPSYWRPAFSTAWYSLSCCRGWLFQLLLWLAKLVVTLEHTACYALHSFAGPAQAASEDTSHKFNPYRSCETPTNTRATNANSLL